MMLPYHPLVTITAIKTCTLSHFSTIPPLLTVYFQVDGGQGESQYVHDFELACICTFDLI